MTDLVPDERWLDEERSGRFTEAARRAATSEALPLLATYFATGADSLRSQQILSGQAVDDLGDLLEFVQIRVLLAAAGQLDPLVRAVLDRPSFRYQRERAESVGVIRGRLDTIRYLRQRHEITVPRTFPVQNVVRHHELSENVLVAWAALTVAYGLKRLPLNRLSVDAPERRRAERAAESLRRLTNYAVLSDCVDPATAVWRRGDHLALLERVRNRLRSGQIANASSYEAVADWVKAFDAQNLALDPGAVEWVFYDETFDTKLFEIWCLGRLIQGLTDLIGPATTTRHLIDRSQGAVATWDLGAIGVEVFFQAGLRAIDVGHPRWAYDPRPQDQAQPVGAFGGIPDITVVVRHPGRPRQPVIVDPKLRQRNAVPGAEIYKIIGYFGNLPPEYPSRGAIIFHGPGSQRSYRIVDKDDGQILAVAVDPLDPQETAGRFADLAAFVIASVPQSATIRARRPDDLDDSEAVEDWVDACQQQAVAELLSPLLPPNALDRARKTLRSNLIHTWDRLDTDTQRMLATAEHFGLESSAAMDHSGPLLGLTAACERIIRAFVIGLNVPLPGALTLGRLLNLLREAATNRPDPPSRQLGLALDQTSISPSELVALIDDLFRVNKQYRIPAAHTDVVEEGLWIAGRAAIIVGPDAALARIVDILGV